MSASRQPRLAQALGLLCALALAVLADGLAGSWGRGTAPLSAWGYLTTVAVHATCVGLAAAALLLFSRVRTLGSTVWGPRRAALISGLMSAMVAWLALVPVGIDLCAGRRISQHVFAPLLRHGLGAGGAAGVILLIGLHSRWPADEGRGLTLIVLAGALGLPLLEAHFVPAGGFLKLHLALIASSSLLFALAGVRAATFFIRVPARLGRALALGGALVLAVSIANWARISSRTKAELLLRAPASGTMLRSFARADSGRLRELLMANPARDRDSGSAVIASSFVRPRGVVLVTVDALRADALMPSRGESGHPVRAGDTPFLDEFIGGSLRFRNAYAQASKTSESLPAMFRSLESFEDPAAKGGALGELMSGFGLRTSAIVNEWFLVARIAPTRALLRGFERVSIYEPHETDQAVDRALAAIDASEGDDFFVWLHLFSSHEPGYAGRELSKRDGPWPQRYRQSVRWLDGEVQRLWTGLEERGLAQDLVFILASDHGEGLGDNGVELHGDTVFEEEIKVPMIWRLPGVGPAEINATVGNIDIIPTLYALFGLPNSAAHRGHSLLPLFADREARWPYAYFARDRYADSMTLIEGRDKVIHSTRADVTMRFDLAQDPQEEHNIFTGGEGDRARLFALLRREPSSLEPELERREVRALLLARLGELDAGTSVAQREFLLRLAKGQGLGVPLQRRFEEVVDHDFRLALLRHQYAEAPDDWREKVVSWIDGAHDRVGLLLDLAGQGQPPFDPSYCARQLEAALVTDPDEARAWLRMFSRWEGLALAKFEGPLVAALVSEDVPTLRDALRFSTGLKGDRRSPEGRRLGKAISEALEQVDASVQVAAVQALAHHPDHNGQLSAVIQDPGVDIRVRQAGLRAMGHVQGVDAIGLIELAAQDERLRTAALLLLGEIVDPASLAALSRLQRELHLSVEHRKFLKQAKRELRARLKTRAQ